MSGKAVSLIVLCMFICPPKAQAIKNNREIRVEGEYLLKTRSSVFVLDLNSLQLVDSPVLNDELGADLFLITESTKLKLETLPLQLRSAVIEYVEPNPRYYAVNNVGTKANDPRLSEQWHLANSVVPTASVGAQDLWNKGILGSKNVVVAVVDSGLDIQHPDIAANVFTNLGEVPGNQIDDDRNGFIDDVHGWDFVRRSGAMIDEEGHGTHVSGIIGAVGNNSTGVSGINWNVSILPLRFLDKSGGGNGKDAIMAINYAVKMGASIINASWGGEKDSYALQDTIRAAQARGVLFVTASGNDGISNELNNSFPANYNLENIVSVAASDRLDHLVEYSNYGKNVHLAAPGEQILSTTPGGKYALMSGTSMAAPMVSGAAALLKAAHPEWSMIDIKGKLLASCRPGVGFRRMVKCGGTLDIANALEGRVPLWDEPRAESWRSQKWAAESVHPYPAPGDLVSATRVPGAKFIRVVFEKIQLGSNADNLCLKASKVGIVECITGSKTNYVSQWLPSDIVVVELIANSRTPGWGYKIAEIQYQ